MSEDDQNAKSDQEKAEKKPSKQFLAGVRESLNVLERVRNEAVVTERDALNRAILAVEELVPVAEVKPDAEG